MWTTSTRKPQWNRFPLPTSQARTTTPPLGASPRRRRNGRGGAVFRFNREDLREIFGRYYIWENYNDLTGIMVNKENHPQMALIQVSEIL
jgi:hypothetical protein